MTFRPVGPLLAIVIGASASLAQGSEALRAPPYSDDRSDPQALIRSLYNAVNRNEYARAWSYFSVPPAKTYDKYVAGFEGTRFVDVVTGRAVEDGAAGSVFYVLPVAIKATADDGSEKIFAGCYTLRQVNPQIQEPPYRGLAIEKGALAAVKDSFYLPSALPEQCDERVPEAETAERLTERVNAIFARAHASDCDLLADQHAFAAGEQPERYELRFRYSSDSQDQPERTARLFRYACATYAYNTAEIFYLADEYGGISEVSLPEPDLAIEYEDDSNAKVKSLKIAGFTSRATVVNSEFDPATQTITSFSKWRGIADAFSSGSWVFQDGNFVLKRFSVDASYDEEQDPQDIINYEAAK